MYGGVAVYVGILAECRAIHDRDLGKVGTPKRDAFESSVDEAVHAYKLGEAIKKRLEEGIFQPLLTPGIGVHNLTVRF